MTVIYDVLLKQQAYKPVIGYVGEPKYICIFYDEDRRKALREMQKYVKRNGFVTPDKKYTVADVVLRKRESTGALLSITPYHNLFDAVTDMPVDQNLTKENAPTGVGAPGAGNIVMRRE